MKSNSADVEKAYDKFADEEEKQENHFSLRTAIPREFIARYIQDDDVVLDAGCGAGVNALMMLKRAKHVTALDISSCMLQKARNRLSQAINRGRATCIKGNVCDLSIFPDKRFDLVVCVGDAVSYSLDRHDVAIRELIRVADTSAIILIGCDSKHGFAGRSLRKGDLEEFESIMETGICTDWTGVPTKAFEAKEMEQLLSDNGCQVLEIAGTPTFSDTIDKSIYSTHEARKRLLELELRYCRKTELLGMGHHLLFVARKTR